MPASANLHAHRVSTESAAAGPIHRLRARMTIWKKSRRVRNELRSLSLRELADLGFVPADIRFVADNAHCCK
jgi:uncharacterized protein YjiS (DUF1127 family)